MIEFILGGFAVFSWPIFLGIMYFASMMVAWWCFGNSDETVGSEDVGLCIFFTLFAPLCCLVYLFSWCYHNGADYKDIVAERRAQKLDRSNENGLTDEQIERLGVHDHEV